MWTALSAAAVASPVPTEEWFCCDVQARQHVLPNTFSRKRLTDLHTGVAAKQQLASGL